MKIEQNSNWDDGEDRCAGKEQDRSQQDPWQTTAELSRVNESNANDGDKPEEWPTKEQLMGLKNDLESWWEKCSNDDQREAFVEVLDYVLRQWKKQLGFVL